MELSIIIINFTYKLNELDMKKLLAIALLSVTLFACQKQRDHYTMKCYYPREDWTDYLDVPSELTYEEAIMQANATTISLEGHAICVAILTSEKPQYNGR